MKVKDLNLWCTYLLKTEFDLDYVYTTLKKIDKFDTYKKEEIPDMLKYKDNVRVGDILIVTKLGYAVYINNQTINWTVTSNRIKTLDIKQNCKNDKAY